MTVCFPGSKAGFAATLLLAVSLLAACTTVIGEPAPQRRGAVPAVEGRNLAAAEAALQRAGFRLGRVTKETTRRAPSGTVLWQDPAAGTRALRGTAVDLLLARQMASVPRLRGLRLKAARRALKGAGFRLGQVTERPSDRGPQGSVVAQSPKASRLAEPGSAVDLVVAVRALPRVPKVKGDPLKAALKTLKHAGLRVGEVREKITEKWLDGTVIRQRPRAGQRVEPGTGVDLVVARAPRAVPRLGGLSLKRAKKSLKRAGLSLGKVAYRTTDQARAGTVVAQDPDDEAYVAPNTRVDLVIARAAPRVPKLSGQSLKKAKKALKKAGLSLGQVTKETTDRARPGTVIAQSPAAATPAAPGLRVDLVVAQAAAETRPQAPKQPASPARADESPLNGKAKAPPRD